MRTDYALAIEWLREQYDKIILDYPRFAEDVDKNTYCRANIQAVLTFDRRMRLLRAEHGDITNAWGPEVIRIIGF